MVFKHYSSEQAMKCLCLANAITDAGTCGYGKNRPMILVLPKRNCDNNGIEVRKVPCTIRGGLEHSTRLSTDTEKWFYSLVQ